MKHPTILIVHGAMHCVDHYRPLMSNLETKGFRCIAASLPSTQSVDDPPAGLDDDTAAIRTAVLNELDNEKNDVLILAHSYGGTPANNALKGLDTKSRSENGQVTSVKALALMCAIAVRAGVSVGTFMASRGNDGSTQAKNALEVDSTGAFGLPKASPGAEEALFNDLPSEEAKKWASLLRPLSMRGAGEDTSYAGFVDIPTGYLYCTKDEMLPLDAQEYIVAEAKKAGGKIVLEETVEASHSPFLSQIEATTSFIQKLVELVS